MSEPDWQPISTAPKDGTVRYERIDVGLDPTKSYSARHLVGYALRDGGMVEVSRALIDNLLPPPPKET